MSTRPAAPLRTDEVARRMGLAERTVRNTLARNRDGIHSSLGEGLPAVWACRRWLVLRPQFEAVFGPDATMPEAVGQ